MTDELFRSDGYLTKCDATVVSTADNTICLDRTVFYPTGGGQPGDTGHITLTNGDTVNVIDTFYDRDTGAILHACDAAQTLPEPGQTVVAEIDWDRRYRLMRMHSCLHMLCVSIPAPVTGGSIRDGSGRLDFDLPEPPDKHVVEAKLNALIADKHAMEIQWISDEEMQAQPELIRTMSVKPPMGSGKVRLIKFGDADLQPCGGTHVSSTEEIGAVRIQSIKKKGKQNRRVTVEFV